MPTDTMELIHRLDNDMKAAARLLDRDEARWLVGQYYSLQEYRKAAANQVRAADDAPEPNRVLAWVAESTRRLEANIYRALGIFAAEYTVGAWLQAITGIGPAISAGLLSQLDIRRAPTAGHFWSFAGITPDVKWLGREEAGKIIAGVLDKSVKRLDAAQLAAVAVAGGIRVEVLTKRMAFIKVENTPIGVAKALAMRPWNAQMKTLCFLAAECFCKFQNHPEDHYGKLYVQRKSLEIERNEAGQLASEAARALSEKNYGKDTEARKWYEQGKLPPAHLHARALRWVEKIFLSHVHHAMYVDYYGKEPPAPYAFTHLEGHGHYIQLPVPFPGEHAGKSLRELLRDG